MTSFGIIFFVTVLNSLIRRWLQYQYYKIKLFIIIIINYTVSEKVDVPPPSPHPPKNSFQYPAAPTNICRATLVRLGFFENYIKKEF